MVVVWFMALCNPVGGYSTFRGTYLLRNVGIHLPDSMVSYPDDRSVIIHHRERRKITGPHTANHSWGCLQRCDQEDCPPHSPDIAPSDFHVFGPLKKNLATDAKVKQAVTSWLHTLDTNLFSAGIQVLVPRETDI